MLPSLPSTSLFPICLHFHGLITLCPYVVRPVLIVPTCDLNFINVPTYDGFRLLPLPTLPIF
jgi:hypothetical protein